MSNGFLKFPDGFVWGAATASYQIEGAFDEDGKSESIWDRFSKTPGKVINGDTGDVADDHYHRYQQDVDLMADVGLKAYRFSVAWPRVVPTGTGAVNTAGLDFYDRLVDALLAKGIEPYATLYHWDLPQVLQDRGGWPNRETGYYFRDYAGVVAQRLGDRVKNWITHNEPWVVAYLGYLMGMHAPGISDLKKAVQSSNTLLFSHGEAVKAIRATAGSGAKVGITLNLSPAHPATDSAEDHAAALRQDGFLNRWFLDPVFLGRYPADILAFYEKFGASPEIKPGDLELASVPIDFLGVNFYNRGVVAADPTSKLLGARDASPRGPGHEYTDMDWEVYPPALHELLVRVKNDYAPKSLFITENGAAYRDQVGANGEIDDPCRLSYLRRHFAQAHRAIADGVPLDGYFVWSLMDNFEWAYGYTKRFGMIYVDFDSQKRTLKSSAKWYKQVIAANGVEPE